MKELRHIIVPDDAYYFVLSYIESTTDYKKKVCDMTKEEFLDAYDKAVQYNRNQIKDNDEYLQELLNDSELFGKNHVTYQNK